MFGSVWNVVEFVGKLEKDQNFGKQEFLWIVEEAKGNKEKEKGKEIKMRRYFLDLEK